ncbi:MAG: phosphatidate cytidylyltransferase, partial [Pseudomonadota bacterium]
MSADAPWSDLKARVLSAALMAIVGLIAVWNGGFLFLELVCAVCGLMVWEAARMFGARLAIALGVMAAVVLTGTYFLPDAFALPLILSTGLVAAGQVEKDKSILFGVITWIMLGCFALLLLR